MFSLSPILDFPKKLINTGDIWSKLILDPIWNFEYEEYWDEMAFLALAVTHAVCSTACFAAFSGDEEGLFQALSMISIACTYQKYTNTIQYIKIDSHN